MSWIPSEYLPSIIQVIHLLIFSQFEAFQVCSFHASHCWWVWISIDWNDVPCFMITAVTVCVSLTGWNLNWIEIRCSFSKSKQWPELVHGIRRLASTIQIICNQVSAWRLIYTFRRQMISWLPIWNAQPVIKLINHQVYFCW